MIRVLFAGGDARWDTYRAPLTDALHAAGFDAEIATDLPGDSVDYIVYAPTDAALDFTRFPNAKAVLSLWAGIESIVTNPTLTQPLTRMVDHGLRQGMREWVCGHVLRHHLGMDRHIHGQDGVWRNGDVPPLASARKTTLLGLGELGRDCAQALAQLGFDIHGWSRSAKQVPGVTCHHGDDGLRAALDEADIVVCLLPLTKMTDGLLNQERLAWLAPGATVINPGRGALIDDDALLGALNTGQVGAATLDVFRVEPLPATHPYWAHPKVTVTPHIASETRPETAVQVIVENIRRGEAGEGFLYLVDRDTGY